MRDNEDKRCNNITKQDKYAKILNNTLNTGPSLWTTKYSNVHTDNHANITLNLSALSLLP